MLSDLKIHPVETNNLFYGKFNYSVKFFLKEAGVIRGLNVDKIDKIVRDRNRWRSENRNIYRFHNDLITPDDVVILKKVCKLLAQHQDSIKFVVSYHTGYIYTNDLGLIDNLSKLDAVGDLRIQQAKQVSPPGTIALKNPKWSHRTYFRCITVSETAKKTLVEYLEGRENVRLSPGLVYWSKHTNAWNNWVQSHYFIDHNNDGEVLFLNMVVPRITGRTMQIVAK